VKVRILHDFNEKVYQVDAEVKAGTPATGPSYASGGHPGDPPEIEIVAVRELVEGPDGDLIEGRTLGFQEFARLLQPSGLQDVDEHLLDKFDELQFDDWPAEFGSYDDRED